MSSRLKEINSEIAKRIRFRRKELGITQVALAEKIGLTYQQLQKYERGYNRVNAAALMVISEELDVPIEYFFYTNKDRL